MIKKNQRNFLRQKADYKYKHTGETAEILITFFILSGFLSALQDIMYDNIVLWMAILTGLLLLGMRYVFSRFGKFGRVFDIVVYALTLISFFVLLFPVIRGFLGVANRIIVLWNIRFETEWRVFSLDNDNIFNSIVFWILASIPLTSFISSLVRKKAQSGVIAFIIIGVLFAFILGRSSMWISVICMTCGILGTIIFSLTPQRRIGIYGFICIMLTFSIFGGMFFLALDYGGSESITLWKKEVSEKIEEIRYGEDTLPQGKLKKANSLLKGDEVTFEITMDYPQSLYLIGFVGGSYTGNEWKVLDKTAYQNEYDGLTEWLDKEGFYIATQYSAYDELNKKSINYKNDEYNTVMVNNLGAYRKYLYLPYSVVSWDESFSEIKKDWQVQSKGIFGAEKYEFKNIIEAPNADGIAVSSWVRFPETDEQRKYANTESVYHHFVNDKYMYINDELKTLIHEFFFSESDYENMDFNEITMQIRTVLRRETRYMDFPPTVGNGKDFITWFIKDSKSGNAIHYASTAVMAYRAAGYPARYVEGYRYVPEETTNANDEKTTVILTNKNSHAWAEVYVTGVGWVPIEVVPGMYVETYTNQIVEGKPAYQISSKQEEEGVDVDSDDMAGGEIDTGEEEQKFEESIPFEKLIPSIILIILYICFFLYLILEGQRALRIFYRRKLESRLQDEKLVGLYAEEIEKTLKCAGIKGNYNHPLELTEDVNRIFKKILKNRYERAIFLIHKVRFGGMKLRDDEKYALSCFVLRIKKELYKDKGFFRKLKLRYGYAIEK